MEHYHFNQWRSAIQVYHLQKLAVFRCSRSDTFYFILSCTREDVRATSTYLIFLPSSNDYLFSFQKEYTSFFSFHYTMMSINILPKPSSNDAIYFSSKNNTRLSFPSINNDVNYYPSKRKNDMN